MLAATVGCDGPRAGLSKPWATVTTGGPVQQGLFSADGGAFLGWVSPAGKDPVARLALGDPGSVIGSPDGRTLAAVGSGSLAFHPLPAPP